MTTRRLLPSIKEFMARKRIQNRRPIYIEHLEYELLRFARGREDMPLAEISAETIESAIKPHWKPTMVCGVLARFSAFLSDCERREYITKNPALLIDRPTMERPAPVVFTVQQVTELLRTVAMKRPDLLAYVVVGTFLGVRPHEVLKLKWSDVDTVMRQLRWTTEPHGVLTIDAAVSKVRRRRIVPIPKTVAEWLSQCDTTAPVGPTSNATRPLAKLAKKLGIKWHHDIMRHTAASYLLAKYEDAARVALWLGNSPSILLTHYYQLIKAEDCNRFWSISPRFNSGDVNCHYEI